MLEAFLFLIVIFSIVSKDNIELKVIVDCVGISNCHFNCWAIVLWPVRLVHGFGCEAAGQFFDEALAVVMIQGLFIGCYDRARFNGICSSLVSLNFS